MTPIFHMPSKMRPENSDETGDESEVCLDKILKPKDIDKQGKETLCDSNKNTINRDLENSEQAHTHHGQTPSLRATFLHTFYTTRNCLSRAGTQNSRAETQNSASNIK